VIRMKLAYHTKTDTHGWHHVITAPIDAPDWHAQDIWAFNFMIENCKRVLTIGWNMYQLVDEK